MPNNSELKSYLDEKVKEINHPDFILDDPISIPKRYKKIQDIEITGFWVAMLAWGQRKTIINKSTELFGLMGDSPYEFILDHKESDRKRFKDFKHRTFQFIDTLYFLDFLQRYYKQNDSLESAFNFEIDAESALKQFHNMFFHSENAPQRTRKHVATPIRGSTCKRLNMFLRWMVRKDKAGVDFGIWNNIPKSKLMIPFDVHVSRVARKLKLITRKQNDWKTVVELTQKLKYFDSEDPVKYDFALYGLGIQGEL